MHTFSNFTFACEHTLHTVADPGKGAQGARPPYFVNASIFKKEQLTIFIVKSERFGNERFKQETKMSE